MTEFERIELEAITFARVPEMPEPLKEGCKDWYMAIASIKTTKNMPSYVIVKNRGENTPPAVVKTFDTEGIGRIEKLYPYKFIKDSLNLKTDNEKKNFVKESYKVKDEDISSLTPEELDKLILNQQIKSSEAKIKVKEEAEANAKERAVKKAEKAVKVASVKQVKRVNKK